MKACHDFKSAMTEGALATIRKRYIIPEEYALHASLPEQRPYNPGSSELSISIDVLEAGLCFPLHLVIEECLGWCDGSIHPSWHMPKVTAGKLASVAQVTPSSPEVEEVCLEAAPRTVPSAILKRSAEKLAPC
ncbi:hypothetical protein BHE74_00016001 [Ensete ventricosum]|nr:hypothetical protein BHE74_00016001 [Ensete ventricosum]